MAFIVQETEQYRREFCHVCGQHEACCDCILIPATATEPAELVPRRGESTLDIEAPTFEEPGHNIFGEPGYWQNMNIRF